jgi:2-keto-4-pentenoate hydratase/2-oxohepta-3-ene-1,7-dioic acid hydratase in catechol pathway
MKFASFVYKDKSNFGVLKDDKIVPANVILRKMGTRQRFSCLKDFIAYLFENRLLQTVNEIVERIHEKGIKMEYVKLLPPIPNPSKIICIGLNYEDYRKILNLEPTKAPTFFLKAPSTLIGNYEEILVPKGTGGIFHEWEIAMVVGKKAKHVRKSEFREYVFGLTIFNDITGHELEMIENRRYQQLAKNIDTYGPMGPWISTLDEFKNGMNNLTLTRKVNGQIVCKSSTSQMRFSFEDILEYLSTFITLYPGDIISTGSPPTGYVKNGDEIEVDVENIGILKNRVKEIEQELSFVSNLNLT